MSSRSVGHGNSAEGSTGSYVFVMNLCLIQGDIRALNFVHRCSDLYFMIEQSAYLTAAN
jgi:hypothetical protein